MSTVIYLANQHVQAVTGTPGQKKISVKQCYSAIAPEGSLINGMVMDPEAFIEFLKVFWAENQLSKKDVTLVINSTKFIGKTIEMPALSDKKTLEYIEREFADVKKDDDIVYGWIPLGSTDQKMKRYYAEAIIPEFIQEYVAMFEEAGIKLKNIYSGESSIITLTDRTIGNFYKTFILEIADDTSLSLLLWVNGSFSYFNAVRSFYEQGTEEYAQDVARSISQIQQFMQAQQIEEPLERIVLAGMKAEDVRLYQLSLAERGMDIEIEMFESDSISNDAKEAGHYLYAASGLYLNNKFHNYLELCKKKKSKSSVMEKNRTGIIIIGICLIIMLVGLTVSMVIKINKKRQLTAVLDYNDNPVTMMEVAEYDMAVERSNFLNAQMRAIQDIDDNIVSYPVCDNGILKVLDQCAGNNAVVVFQSFDADAGVVRVIATSDTVDHINAFIKQLNQQEIFNEIDYTGYSYDEGRDLWDIHVSCTLAEAAGR